MTLFQEDNTVSNNKLIFPVALKTIIIKYNNYNFKQFLIFCYPSLRSKFKIYKKGCYDSVTIASMWRGRIQSLRSSAITETDLFEYFLCGFLWVLYIKLMCLHAKHVFSHQFSWYMSFNYVYFDNDQHQYNACKCLDFFFFLCFSRKVECNIIQLEKRKIDHNL